MFTKICLCHHIAHFPSRLWMAGWPPVSNLCAPTHNQQNHILTAVLKSCGTGCGNSFAVKSDLNTFHLFSTAMFSRVISCFVVIISFSWLFKLHCCSFRKGVFLALSKNIIIYFNCRETSCKICKVKRRQNFSESWHIIRKYRFFTQYCTPGN